MGQALYRKYRSKTLAEMVGQEHVTEALANAIKSGRISHAYLFTGPRGVGKTSAARILAHEINNLPYDETQQHLDIIEIDAASNRRIDDIRDLRDKVHIAPTSSKFKVYIVDEVHMLTGESFNALLKTLEEPPEHVVFILATTEAHKLPATIISRTQRFNFRLVDREKVVAHLRFIAKEEGITIEDEALYVIADYGEGSFRDSIGLLDQLANINKGGITLESVEKSLGLAPKKVLSSIIEAIIAKDFSSTNQLLNSLEAQGTNIAALVPQLTKYLLELAPKHAQIYRLLDQLIEVPKSYNPRLKLRTTLIQFALPESAQAGATTPKESPKPTAKPTPVAVAQPILKVEKPQPTKPKPRQQPEQPQQAQGNKLNELTAEQWAQILARTKQQSVPLHGILRQAQPDFDPNSQTLTLKFRYALHQKRADDAKTKKIIATIMLEQLGGAPIIHTAIDTGATAPEADIAPPPEPSPPPEQPKRTTDDVAQAVIDMMGGGEVVNA